MKYLILILILCSCSKENVEEPLVDVREESDSIIICREFEGDYDCSFYSQWVIKPIVDGIGLVLYHKDNLDELTTWTTVLYLDTLNKKPLTTDAWFDGEKLYLYDIDQWTELGKRE